MNSELEFNKERFLTSIETKKSSAFRLIIVFGMKGFQDARNFNNLFFTVVGYSDDNVIFNYLEPIGTIFVISYHESKINIEKLRLQIGDSKYESFRKRTVLKILVKIHSKILKSNNSKYARRPLNNKNFGFYKSLTTTFV